MFRRTFFAAFGCLSASLFGASDSQAQKPCVEFKHYSAGSKVGGWLGWLEHEGNVVGFLFRDGSFTPTPDAYKQNVRKSSGT